MQQQVGVAVFLSVLLVITLSNLFYFKRLQKGSVQNEVPGVSVLLPVRNEEDNIRACIETVLSSDYPDFEVLVLNDGSKDGTAAVLSEISRNDDRIKVFEGKPLPPGWFGKHWACDQLAGAATGKYILFTDADTRHTPQVLGDAVSKMLDDDIDFLTLFPKEEVKSWAEKLTLPIMSFSFLAIIPLALAYRTRMSGLSSANGQFMLFRKEAYEIIGGHEAVKDRVLDDFSLAGKIKKSGFKWRFFDGSDRISCRMYKNIREVYSGLGKNLFSVFGCHSAIYVFIWFWMGFVFIGTPIIGALCFSDVLSFHKLGWLCAANTLLGFTLWAIAITRFHFPWYLAFLYPLIVAMSICLAMTSFVLVISGNGRWKGRALIRPKVHWI